MTQAPPQRQANPYKSALKRMLSVKLMPDYIIIGAQKCGTGSLFDYLATHPNVIKASQKEVNFFDVNFHRGLSWYRTQFPLLADQYYRRRLQGEKMITGEASPNYMIHPLAPSRIHEIVPKVKLIALLRNPVERTYSQYQHNLRDRSETLSFEEALRSEPERIAGEHERIHRDPTYDGYKLRKFSYHHRGVYIDQLKMWTDVIPREQILILQFEEMCRDPAKVYRQTLDFLQLPEWDPGSFGRSNYFGRYNELTPETRQYLTDYFQPHNERLYDFLGARYDW